LGLHIHDPQTPLNVKQVCYEVRARCDQLSILAQSQKDDFSIVNLAKLSSYVLRVICVLYNETIVIELLYLEGEKLSFKGIRNKDRVEAVDVSRALVKVFLDFYQRVIGADYNPLISLFYLLVIFGF